MSNSLELRTPYLDKDLIEFMSSVSFQNKNKNSNKSIYRDVLKKIPPSEMTTKGKMGFGIPIEIGLAVYLKIELMKQLTIQLKNLVLLIIKILKIWKLHLENKLMLVLNFGT